MDYVFSKVSVMFLLVKMFLNLPAVFCYCRLFALSWMEKGFILTTYPQQLCELIVACSFCQYLSMSFETSIDKRPSVIMIQVVCFVHNPHYP